MKKLSGLIQKSGINVTEQVILIYLILTAIYILIGGASGLPEVGKHLLARLFMAGIIFFVAYITKSRMHHKAVFLLRHVYPLLFLGYLYKETGYMNNILFDYFDPWFVKLEEYLWGFQPSLVFSVYFNQKWFSELMNFGYFFYYLLTLGTALAVFYYRPKKTEKAVFIIITSFLLYYLFFALFPVEGPQFYFSPEQAKTVDSYFFSHLVKMVQESGETQTGAFPSSHVGMSIVFLLLNYRYARKVFWIILVPVIFLWFATVYIKAHYLIDTIMGFPSGFLVYWLSVKIYDRLTRQKITS